MARTASSTAALRLAAFGLLFQLLLPNGYMPAPVASGWLLALCPDGLSAHARVVLFGDHASHGHHAHHGHHGDAGGAGDAGDAGDDGAAAHAMSACDVAGASLDPLADNARTVAPVVSRALHGTILPDAPAARAERRTTFARAPPLA